MFTLLFACTGAPVSTDTGDTSPPAVEVPDGPPAPVSGTAFAFDPDGGRIADATIGVVEVPGLQTVSDADGDYTLDVPTGSTVTLTITHPDYAAVQTASLPLPAEGVVDLDLQVPDWEMVELLAAFVGTELDPAMCQIASTVLRPPGAEYEVPDAEGEPGVTVTLDPPVDPALGPVYFNIARANLIWPDRDLTETTEDGGVLFVNVPEGVYTIEAHKAGMSFTSRLMTCRPGWIVNAGPPLGLVAQ
ncbi:MAG: carboxypeptidase-like regulatory domain-containing protein [Pseudomonadota bacterium]|nr:carboxypeptidase-like regulatory domain-containing protein [Pseudomonadota bacterium]